MLRWLLGPVMALLVASSPAAAFQCPVLIKQLTDAIARMNPGDSKVREAQRIANDARRLHEQGQHADSIATAAKAARVLGFPLSMAKMTPNQEEQVRAAERRIGK